MFCGRNFRCDESGSEPVYLNVYDLTRFNSYAYWFGVGVYHSGVQVHGVEYAFGCHEYPSTGIFEGEPKKGDGFLYRESILIGKTEMNPEEVKRLMEDLAEEYRGNAYNLVTKNCNHFSEDACYRLTSKSIPSWVNRLARIGFLCNCVLPIKFRANKIGHDHRIEDDIKSPNESTKKVSSHPSPPSSPLCAALTRGRSQSRRHHRPSSPPLR